MQYMEVHQLKQKGFSVKKIAEKLGISRNTVYRNLEKSPEKFNEWLLSSGTKDKKLDPYQDLILNWLKEHSDLSGAQVYDWLKERYPNFMVGESTVRRYVNELREIYSIPKQVTYRQYQAVEELPMGKQIQVDFGETIVKTKDEKSKKLWFIGFVLAHSRYKYVEWRDRPFTTRDVIQCHEAAFDYFGGMSEELVYDQDHLIAVSENAGDIILTKEFQSYQQMRKFNVFLCRKNDPETKGKIESVVKYVKRNFSKNRVFTNLEIWNELCLKWLDRTANFNVHHTTKKRPFEVAALEKQHLKRVSTQFSFENQLETSITRLIQKDNVVKYNSNRYSVPTGTYQPKRGNIAYLEVTENQRLYIRLSKDGEIIADHAVHSGKGELIQDPNHKRKRPTRLEEWQQEIRKAFKNTEAIDQFFLILREQYPRHMGDQLNILWNLVQHDSEWIDVALHRVITLRLKSANDLRDLVYSLKQEAQQGEVSPKKSQNSYSHITASTRKVDSYIAIMKGGQLA